MIAGCGRICIKYYSCDDMQPLVNVDVINLLYDSYLIVNFNATQVPIQLLLALAPCTPHIQPDVNHVIMTRHVRSPIDAKLVDN